jgi:hypothetical protein
VTLCDIRYLAAATVADALREMEAVAIGTYARNFFYHANINPLDTERLTAEQWDYAVSLLEKNLGLENNARFIVEHMKKGRTHRHIVWSRIEVPRMRAVDMTDDYAKHQAVARQLEHEFGLRSVKSVLGPEKIKGQRPRRRPKSWETFRGHKSGIDPHAMTEEVTALYRSSVNGEAFAAALSERGYRLVKGDRRDYCLIDAAGHVHSMARRLHFVKAGELESFMAGIDRNGLPSVAEARKEAIKRLANSSQG